MSDMTAEFDVISLRRRRHDSPVNRVAIGDMLERIARNYPDRIAFHVYADASESGKARALSYREANEYAAAFGRAISSYGVNPGQIVSLICSNSVEAILIKFGLAKAGITVAPLNPFLAEDVLRELLKQLAPATIVIDHEYYKKFKNLIQELNLDVSVILMVGSGKLQDRSFSHFIRNSDPREDEVNIHGDDIWQILYTSGTSALPKGVMISHIKTTIEAYSFTADITNSLRHKTHVKLAIALPVVYHSSDVLLYSALLCGGEVHLTREVNFSNLASMIDEFESTACLAGSPRMVNQLCDALSGLGREIFPHLNLLIFAFAPLAPEIYSKAQRIIGPQIRCMEIAGQTEILGQFRYWIDLFPGLYARTSPAENYVGLIEGISTGKIVSDSGEPVSIDSPSIGEMCYRSPAVMAGYYKLPDATREVFSCGWFHSGDAFQRGERGLYKLVDRKKDIIKSGGENVSSLRVENVIAQHPDVLKVAVVGLPHSRWDEAVTAFVVTKRGVNKEEILNSMAPKLAKFERPKDVVFLRELPESVGGKIKKTTLRNTFLDHYK